MISVETRYNAQENYLKCWCATCPTTLLYLSYGVELVDDKGMEIMDSTATRHQQRHPKHKIFVYEGERLPTIQELRG
jgi:hypothetical protein